MAICWEKNDNFCQLFWKKCQDFGNFLTVKCQFSGGSDGNSREQSGDSHLGHYGRSISVVFQCLSTCVEFTIWLKHLMIGCPCELLTLLVNLILILCERSYKSLWNEVTIYQVLNTGWLDLGPKWVWLARNGIFFRSDSVNFGSPILSRICHIFGQSVPLWTQIWNPCVVWWGWYKSKPVIHATSLKLSAAIV